MDKCPGCQRDEIHKMCPAYGTPYYMSGIPYSIRTETLFNLFPLDLRDLVFDVCKMVYEDQHPNPQFVEHLSITTELGREVISELGRNKGVLGQDYV